MKVLSLEGLKSVVEKTKNLISESADNTLENSKTYTDSKIDTVNKTYIKDLSVSGKIITYTKGDGTTDTITTQDTNTTYKAATSSALGLVKSGTDITVDTSGNVSVNDNSHKHTVSNISDLTATATELNYCDGVTSNIQTQLNGKAASSHGNHVPTTETANNAKFLRNDNTWQT